MGIISKPEIHMYWSTDSIISTPIFSRLMRCDRFEQIRSMIHFTDSINENSKDPLRKLSSFLEELQKKSVFKIIFRSNMSQSMNIFLHGRVDWVFDSIYLLNENDMG